MSPLKKHETPADLDEFFEREEISRKDYAEFWGGYWKAEAKGTTQEFLDGWFGYEEEIFEEESPFASFWESLQESLS